jgi:hypothetical protein
MKVQNKNRPDLVFLRNTLVEAIILAANISQVSLHGNVLVGLAPKVVREATTGESRRNLGVSALRSANSRDIGA